MPTSARYDAGPAVPTTWAGTAGRCRLVLRASEHLPADVTVAARQLLRSELEGHLDDLPVEAERYLVIAVIDRRAGVHADIEGLVDRHEERNGMRDLLVGDFLV